MTSVILYVALLCAVSNCLVDCQPNFENGLEKKIFGWIQDGCDHFSKLSLFDGPLKGVASFVNLWIYRVEEFLCQIVNLIATLFSKLNEWIDQPEMEECTNSAILVSYTDDTDGSRGIAVYTSDGKNNGKVTTVGRVDYIAASGNTNRIYTLEDVGKSKFQVVTYSRAKPSDNFSINSTYELPDGIYLSIAVDPTETYMLVPRCCSFELATNVMEITANGSLQSMFTSNIFSGGYLTFHPKEDNVFALPGLGFPATYFLRTDAKNVVLKYVADYRTSSLASQCVFSSNGKYLYVVDDQAQITVFDLSSGNATGIQIVPETKETKNGTKKVLIDSSDRFLYVLSPASNTIIPYTVNESDGTLSENGAPTATGNRKLNDFALSPDGKKLIVTDEDANKILLYRIVDNGQLKQLESIDTGTKKPTVILLTRCAP